MFFFALNIALIVFMWRVHRRLSGLWMISFVMKENVLLVLESIQRIEKKIEASNTSKAELRGL